MWPVSEIIAIVVFVGTNLTACVDAAIVAGAIILAVFAT